MNTKTSIHNAYLMLSFNLIKSLKEIKYFTATQEKQYLSINQELWHKTAHTFTLMHKVQTHKAVIWNLNSVQISQKIKH